MELNQSSQPYFSDNTPYYPTHHPDHHDSDGNQMTPQPSSYPQTQPYNQTYNPPDMVQGQHSHGYDQGQHTTPECPQHYQHNEQMYTHPQDVETPMVQNDMPSKRQLLVVYGLPEYLNGLPTKLHSRKPQQFYCYSCSKPEVSQAKYKMGTCSWIWCVGLFFTLPILSCVPCCFDDCKDVVHACPECGMEVGRNKACR